MLILGKCCQKLDVPLWTNLHNRTSDKRELFRGVAPEVCIGDPDKIANVQGEDMCLAEI